MGHGFGRISLAIEISLFWLSERSWTMQVKDTFAWWPVAFISN